MTEYRQPVAGTKRRLEALMLLGWLPDTLARLAGVQPITIERILDGTTSAVNPTTYKNIKRIHDALWDWPPQPLSTREANRVAGVKARARSAGFAPTMAWDDIDNPRAKPKGIRQDDSGTTGIDEIVALLRSGESALFIARRLKVRPESIARRLRRAGRHREAREFELAQIRC